MKTNRTHGSPRWWRCGAAALAAAALLGGCDLLDVDNPGAITEPELDDPARIPLMVHGVMGEFQRAYGWYTLYTGSFSGELTDTHVFAENRDVQLREVSSFTGLLNTNYVRLQRTRAAGDNAAQRIREILGGEAEQHLGVARSLAYSGYALTLLAESYCSAPVNVSAAHPPEALFAMALERFDDAITVATAGRAANVESADSLLSLARLGAARAALGRAEDQRAIGYAEQVPSDFEFWVAFSDNSTAEWNQFWNATRFGNAHLQPGPGFLELDDPRVPRTPDLRVLQVPAGFSSAEQGYLPLPPMNYEGWGVDTVITQQTTDVRFASGLEARYIIAEAEGPTGATLTFVNERRAVGGQDPVALSGEELMAELRDQRRRDLYLTGHRLGDLRRYIARYNRDYFPTGEWVFPPNEGTNPRVYGTDTCFPIPNSELNSNPNL